MQAARAFNYRYMLDKIGKPVDRSEWGMSPQTVNAYYNSTRNEIVFPAAILQPPFFDPDADPALNYGGIGAVIGHELMHGYDDSGSQFEAKGNFDSWWTPEDRKAFEARADRLVAHPPANPEFARYPTGATLVVDFDIADWGQAGFGPGMAVDFLAPRATLA